MLRAHAHRGPAFVLATRQGAFLLTDPHPGFLHTAAARLPVSLRTMHVTVLHALIDTVWAIPAPHIDCAPSATTAVRQAHEHGGQAEIKTMQDLLKPG
ncbi:MAG: hypothetical protein ACRDTE_23180 [Pseudonocardiaceae bacterium]